MENHRVDFNLKAISPKIEATSTTGGLGITAGSDLVETSMFVFVKIFRARHLLSHAHILDPYVEVKIGSFRSLGFRNHSEQEWDQVFALEIDQLKPQDTTIGILVKNNALRYDEYIGQISVDVSDIPIRFPIDSELAPKWCGLKDQVGRFCGELMMSCWIGTQADKAFRKAFHLQSISSSIDVYNVVNTISEVYVIPRIWCLRVHLIQIQGPVFSEDAFDGSRIFIRVSLGRFFSTSKLGKSSSTGTLIWNEDLFFAVAEPFDKPLIVSVEKVTFSRNRMSLGTGEYHVTIKNIRLDGSPKPIETITVKQNERDKFGTGELSVRISLDGGYHMFDDEPQYRSDVKPTHPELWLPNVGVFELGILNATGLPSMKPSGRTDAYCVAKYGSKWVRSRTVINSLSPKWNEQYSWNVYDPSTFITICVFDNCQLLEGNVVAGGVNDTRIGKVRICLSEMETNRVYTYSYRLLELQPSGLKNMGEIQLAFRFTVPNWFHLCKVYTLPMLPAQHFADPLSPIQYKHLRQQTVRLVASKVGGSEPILRSEVVEYMLDSREIVWSMRRCRADFERVMVIANGLVSIYTQLDEIRRWKDWKATFIIIILVFLIVIVLPQYLLSTIFSCLLLHVIGQFRKKPKKLSHIDLHLSHVHAISTDELEEEFDPIPSSFGEIIMRNRYDRLRIVAGRYVQLMSDIATGFERLESLLSWQDPTATMFVMVLCFITGNLSSVLSFKFIFSVWFVYLIRPPMFRSPFPAFYKNWLRRMPSKLDYMI